MAAVVPRKILRSVSLLAVALLAACGNEEERRTQRPNVLLVTLDTTRADRLGCYGLERALTPTIDRIAAEGTRFTRAFTPIPSTLPSHTSIHTGLHPLQHGVHDNGAYFVEEERTTLAEVLSAAGYDSAAFVAAFVLDSQFGLDQGFDVYDDSMEAPLSIAPGDLPADLPEEKRRWYEALASAYQRPASSVTRSALEWLRSADRSPDAPFFLWVHYFDAHAPYQAPGEDATRFDPDYDGPVDGTSESFFAEAARLQSEGRFTRTAMARHVEHMIARYDGELAALDRSFGELIAALRADGTLDHTLVVVVGDHGESFGEHQQIFEHNGEIYDEVVHVPLLVRRPDGVGAGAVVDRLVRTYDVAPTVLDYLGLRGGEKGDGRSILPSTVDPNAETAGDVVLEAMREVQIHPAPLSWLGLRTVDRKVVLEMSGTTEVRGGQRYSLGEDPGERTGTAIRPDDAVQALLLDRVKAWGRPHEALPLRSLGEIDVEALRKIGYLPDRDEPDDRPPR